MKDSAILHFLKQFPPWIVLSALLIVFVGLYFSTGDMNYKEWVSLILASLFTALGVRAAQPQPTVQAEKIETVNAGEQPKDETSPEAIGAFKVEEEK